MFKRVKPAETLHTTHGTIFLFPHCDQRVLHAPGECEFCDRHPEWQALRAAWGICFTGYAPEGTELPCPADHARPDGAAERWSGNRAHAPGAGASASAGTSA